jgi:hypothetical protein
MDEQVIDDLYNRAVSKGYTKSKGEFVQLLHSDNEVFNDMYSYVKEKGYQKTSDDFSTLVGKKKSVRNLLRQVVLWLHKNKLMNKVGL